MNMTVGGSHQPCDLLLVLDAAVQERPAPKKLWGEVCIGIRLADGYRWWRARIGRRFTSGFISERSETAHATLFVGANDAVKLMETGAFPKAPELLMIDGERDFMHRVLSYFCSVENPLSVRMRGCS